MSELHAEVVAGPFESSLVPLLPDIMQAPPIWPPRAHRRGSTATPPAIPVRDFANPRGELFP